MGDHTSAVERCFSRVPMFMSYVILITTWIGFVLVISLRLTLIKQGATGHFLIQQTVYNFLFVMTILSLIVATVRGPGRPDPSLAPPGVCRPPNDDEKPNRREQMARQADIRTVSSDHRPPPVVIADPDEIPLRFLRNSRWVSSRIGKDRPSPLPIRSTRNLAKSRAVDEDGSLQGETTEDEESLTSGPLDANPLVPYDPAQAGEDYEEWLADQHSAAAVEGGASSTSDDDEREMSREEDDVAGPLLARDRRRRGGEQTAGRRSVMAKSNDGGPRWCRKCDAWKPDRTHHCRYCGQCSLRMDHHCIWLGTCVGFNNYKPFLLFITYASLLALYATAEAGYQAFRFFQDPDDFMSGEQAPGEPYSPSDETLDPSPLIAIAMMLIGLVFVLSVGTLTGYHWWLISRNMTTLENITFSYPSVLLDSAEGRTASRSGTQWKADHLLTRDERNRLRGEARRINVYDIGLKKNLRSVFGDRSTFLAFWPTIRAYRRFDTEAGHFFEVDEDSLQRLQTLTRELRLGSRPSSDEPDSEPEYPSDSEDGATGIEGSHGWDVQPSTGTSGERGDDELTDVESVSSVTAPRRPVPWFQPE